MYMHVYLYVCLCLCVHVGDLRAIDKQYEHGYGSRWSQWLVGRSSVGRSSRVHHVLLSVLRVEYAAKGLIFYYISANDISRATTATGDSHTVGTL